MPCDASRSDSREPGGREGFSLDQTKMQIDHKMVNLAVRVGLDEQ
jgi:hypothetical protein